MAICLVNCGLTFSIIAGVDHAHEIMFLWTMPYRYNESEAILAKRMTTTWTNFATFGYYLTYFVMEKNDSN